MTEAMSADERCPTDEWVRTLEAASTDEQLGSLLEHGRLTKVAVDGVGFDGSPAPGDLPPRHLRLGQCLGADSA